MAILKTDIKLMASERLTDFYDGGGAMTGNEVITAELNNLFPDISRLDRTYGRVSLRKCFPAVMTANSDMYYGAHAIITDPPDDDNVYVTMFSRGDFDDIRQDAQDRMESYVSIAGETLLRPMYDQLEGQRAIVCFQAISAELPEVGETIVMYNSSTGDTQYVRITGISSVTTTFATENTTFNTAVVTIDLSAALEYEFPGIEPTNLTTRATTRIHSTVVADASKYYGVSKVVQSIAQGEFNVWADSIYNQLVPTSQIEAPAVDQFMGGDTFTYYPKGAVGSLTFSGSRNQDTNIIHMPDGIQPGSLTVDIGGYVFQDVRGVLEATDTDGGYEGSVDYASGQVVIDKTTWSATVTITATPACPVSESYMTMEVVVSLENRSYNYVPNLDDPLPKPGSIIVDYMAQGKWYRMYDNGRGIFTTIEENTGTGTIDYVSGSCVITLGALPDVGSSIIVSWGVGITVTDEAGSVTNNEFEIVHEINNDSPIYPGTAVLTWDDGQARTLTDNGDGTLSGDGAGTIDYGDGNLRIKPIPIPATATTIAINYDKAIEGNADDTVLDADVTYAGDLAQFTLSGLPIMERTFVVTYTRTYISSTNKDTGRTSYKSQTYTLADDGAGNLYVANRWGDITGKVQEGTINYATGAIEIDAVDTYSYPEYYRVKKKKWYGSAYWVTRSTTKSAASQHPVSFRCRFVGTTVTPATANFDDEISTVEPKLYLLTSHKDNSIVPNSVVFELDGDTYYDVGNGDVYKNKSSTTGFGNFAGNISYSTSLVTLATSDAITNPSITVSNMLTKDYNVGVETFNFRTPGAPARAGSFSCRATDGEGATYTAISETTGVISDTGIEGTIDNENGVVRLKFGEYVLAAGNEAEEWYDEDLVVDLNVWKPMDIIPETALYNVVYYSTLPLDSSIVGIEPIRLPTDGRVPIFKSGDVVVLHHTDSESIGNTFTNGQVINLSRAALSIVDLYDYEGTYIAPDEAKYTVDLDAGTITIGSDLLDEDYLNGFTNGNTENITCTHRIEDMLLLSEAQINGFLTSVGPITHDYPSIGAQVSTALIFGDLAGRIVRIFHQKTWDGIYRDSLSGDDSTAKYDTLNYPLILQNEGSADQRWVIKFTSSSTVDVIGETLGVILSGANIANEIAPINPATSTPYFTILNTGWGAGWVSGNNIRFDTTAANFPVWIARTTMQGSVTEPTDNFVMQIRGDAN